MDGEGKTIIIDLGFFRKIIVVAFLLAVLYLELQVTFKNPIAFGDEGFHVSLARWIGEQNTYPVYGPLVGSELQQENMNRPPLWNLTEASFYSFFGFSPNIIKFLMPFIAFITGLAIFSVLRKVYSENIAVIATILATTIPSYVTYAVFFYTTVPYVLYFSLAFLTFLLALKTNRKRYWVMTGIFSGLAMLTNIAGIALFGLYAIIGLIELLRNSSRQNFFSILKKYGAVILISLIILAPWMLRNMALYSVPGCTNPLDLVRGQCPTETTYPSQFEFEGRTAEVGTESTVLGLGVVPYVQFAYGFSNPNQFLNLIGITFIAFTTIAGFVIAAKRRENIDIAVLTISIIFTIIFLRIGLTGRAEDVARYFLSVIPVIGVLSALYFGTIIEIVNRFKKFVIPLVLFVVIIFAFANIDIRLNTLNQVKGFSPLFFEACDWVKQNVPQDAALFSLNTYPTIYNCERKASWEIPYKADIVLSNDLDLVKDRLKQNGINYIFVQKFSLSSSQFGQSYPISFVQFLEENSESFEKVYENGPNLQQCISQGGCDGTIIYKVL